MRRAITLREACDKADLIHREAHARREAQRIREAKEFLGVEEPMNTPLTVQVTCRCGHRIPWQPSNETEISCPKCQRGYTALPALISNDDFHEAAYVSGSEFAAEFLD